MKEKMEIDKNSIEKGSYSLFKASSLLFLIDFFRNISAKGVATPARPRYLSGSSSILRSEFFVNLEKIVNKVVCLKLALQAGSNNRSLMDPSVPNSETPLKSRFNVRLVKRKIMSQFIQKIIHTLKLNFNDLFVMKKCYPATKSFSLPTGKGFFGILSLVVLMLRKLSKEITLVCNNIVFQWRTLTSCKGHNVHYKDAKLNATESVFYHLSNTQNTLDLTFQLKVRHVRKLTTFNFSNKNLPRIINGYDLGLGKWFSMQVTNCLHHFTYTLRLA